MKKKAINPRVYAALHLGTLKPVGLVSLGTRLIVGFTGNLSTPDPDPALDLVLTAVTALQNAIVDAETGGAHEQEVLALAVNTLETLLVRLKEYAENVANATPAQAASILTSTGLELAKMPEKSPAPGQVETVTLKLGKLRGTVSVKGSKTAYARVYQFEYKRAADNDFTLFAVGTKKSAELAGLTNGVTYNVRMRGLNSAGIGEWSEVVSIDAY